MNGSTVRQARKALGWTQSTLASRLGVTQGYVSLLETGRREPPPRLARRLVALLRLPMSTLPVTREATPLSPARTAGALSTLGYPGFAHVTHTAGMNPSELLVRTLLSANVEARLVEALPWVLTRFADLDWPWLVSQAKQHDLQNRLGFVVTLARQLAERRRNPAAAHALRHWESILEDSRLQKEDAFVRDGLTNAERTWLRANRSAEAAHWNLLSNVDVDTLAHA